MPIERKLAAIMFTDIAGYTALSAKDSKKTSELLKTQRETLKPIVEKHGGSWMKEMGDGLLLIFDSATSAVECSIAIQKVTKDIENLNLRIGIHEGEVIKQDGDVLGDDVNVAARIEPFSAEGGVAISQKVQQAISSNTEFETKYIGKPKLKGVSQEVKVYCITSHGLPHTDLSKVSAKLEKESNFNIFALTGGILTFIGISFWIVIGVLGISFADDNEVPSIAIIPFENKGEKKDDFYAYSISSDLISDISNLIGLRVASLNDIETLDLKSLKNREISKMLNVRYIFHGALWKSDSIFQLSMELYDSYEERISWSESWQEEWNNLPTLKDSLADKIFKNLKIDNKLSITKHATGNAEAYALYLKAQSIMKKRESFQDIEVARKLLEKAIEIDSRLYEAIYLLGNTYYFSSDYDIALDNYFLVYSKSNDKKLEWKCLSSIGSVNYRVTDFDSSLVYHRKALALAIESNNEHFTSYSLSNIGNIFNNRAFPDSAESYFIQTKAIMDKINNEKSKIYSKYDSARKNELNGEFDSAIKKYQELITIDTINEDFVSKTSNLDRIGRIFLKSSSYDSALFYFNKSYRNNNKLKDKVGLIKNFENIASTYASMGDYENAMIYYNKTYALQKELGNKFEMTYSLDNIGRVLRKQGNYELGIKNHKLVIKLNKELGINNNQNIVQEMFIASMLTNMGDYDNAIEYLNVSLSKSMEINDKENIAYSYIALADIFFELNDFEKYQSYMNRLYSMDVLPDDFETRENSIYYNIRLELINKSLNKPIDIAYIKKITSNSDEVDFQDNLLLFKLIEDNLYLETAYSQVQEKASSMEEELGNKFLSYPIPKAIVEAWEKVK